MQKNENFHESSEVSENAKIGNNTRVWNNSQIREDCIIGNDCIISKNCYIDKGVKIGNNVKIQNNVSLFKGCEVEDGVFIGPHVCFTNDKIPRAINPDGTLKKSSDWDVKKTKVKYGASIGANSTILPGITLGSFCMVGAGSVVTKDVLDYSMVVGNPAKKIGEVDKEGNKIN